MILIILDLFLLCFSFMIFVALKPASLRLVLPNYIVPFIDCSIIWIFISLIMGKYSINNFRKTIHLFITLTIITFIILSIVVLLLFALKITEISRLIVLGTALLCYILELITFKIIYIILKKNDNNIEEKKEENSIIIEFHNDLTYERVENKENANQTKKNFSREFLISDEAGSNVYQYISEHINVNDESIALTATTTPFNIYNIPKDELPGIINLKKVNDMRYINKFFEAVNIKLRDAGLYVGCVETIPQRNKRIESKFPPVVSQIIILFDFIFNRVLPKIAFFKKIYFTLTSGEERTISKAEVLGRLVSCGFEIIEYKEINDLTYFVVMKTGKPEYNPAPSYGPLLKIQCIGKGGKTFYAYKFRTMYPFSEYLHDYVIKLNGYSLIGRPIEDFRLTKWGKFLRKFWLDELPQIINVLKGDMKLIGIRPLSQKALEDYPEDIKQMRIKHKPGCIPPYVALLKQGRVQSIEAERIYLIEKENNPYITDFKYFTMALLNIINNKIKNA